MKKRFDFRKNLWGVIGIVVCFIAFCYGFYVFGKPVSSYIGDYSFGADFYTEIYKATSIAATRISYLMEDVNEGIGTLIMCISAIGACYFGSKLQFESTAEVRQKPVETKEQPVVTPTETIESKPTEGTDQNS